jgi:hypothetical protein
MVQVAELHKTMAFLSSIYEKSQHHSVHIKWIKEVAVQAGISRRAIPVLINNQMSGTGDFYKWNAPLPNVQMAAKINEELGKKRKNNKEEIISLHKGGMKIPDIAVKTGIPYSTVYWYCVRTEKEKVVKVTPKDIVEVKTPIEEKVIAKPIEKKDEIVLLKVSRKGLKQTATILWLISLYALMFLLGWFFRQFIN